MEGCCKPPAHKVGTRCGGRSEGRGAARGGAARDGSGTVSACCRAPELSPVRRVFLLRGARPVHGPRGHSERSGARAVAVPVVGFRAGRGGCPGPDAGRGRCNGRRQGAPGPRQVRRRSERTHRRPGPGRAREVTRQALRQQTAGQQGGTCLPAGEDEDGARPCSRTAPTRVPRSRSGRHGRPGGRVRPRGGSPRGRGRHRVRSPCASGPPGGPGCSPARRAGTGPRCGGVPWPGRGAWRGPIPPPVARWRPCPGTRT